jgi:hypothetical protein
MKVSFIGEGAGVRGNQVLLSGFHMTKEGVSFVPKR